MTKLEPPQQRNLYVAAILSAILIISSQIKPIFKHEPEFDESNVYMKFERNRIKMSKLERPKQQPDMWQPFCQPSWISFVVQNPYSFWNQGLMEAIHI